MFVRSFGKKVDFRAVIAKARNSDDFDVLQ